MSVSLAAVEASNRLAITEPLETILKACDEYKIEIKLLKRWLDSNLPRSKEDRHADVSRADNRCGDHHWRRV